MPANATPPLNVAMAAAVTASFSTPCISQLFMLALETTSSVVSLLLLCPGHALGRFGSLLREKARGLLSIPIAVRRGPVHVSSPFCTSRIRRAVAKSIVFVSRAVSDALVLASLAPVLSSAKVRWPDTERILLSLRTAQERRSPE